MVVKKVPLPCPSPAALHEADFHPLSVFAFSSASRQTAVFLPISMVMNCSRQAPTQHDVNPTVRRQGACGPDLLGRSEARPLPRSRRRRCTRSRHRLRPHFAIESDVHTVNIWPPKRGHVTCLS